MFYNRPETYVLYSAANNYAVAFLHSCFYCSHALTFAGFSNDATDLLMSYDWPGNIRELRNALESMIVLEKGRLVNREMLGKYLQGTAPFIAERNLPVVTNKSVEQAERELIYRALLDIRSNITELKDILMDRLVMQGKGENHEGNGEDENTLSLDEMEKRMIIHALDRYAGNRRLAARDLRISERTLYRKIKDYGLQE